MGHTKTKPEKLLSLLADAHAEYGADPFTPQLLDRLADLMECQFATYYEVDTRTRTGHGYTPCSLEARLACDPPPQRPTMPASEEPVRLWSESFTRSQRWRFEAIPWAESYAVVDGAVASFSAGPFRRSRLVLHAQHRDFDGQDRRSLHALIPHARALVRNARARRQLAGLVAAIDSSDDGPAGLVLLGNRLEIEHASPAARHLIKRWFGKFEARLPQPVEDWLCRSDEGRQLRIERQGRRLVIDAPTEGALVLTEEKLLPSSLTPKEVEILRELASGKSTAEIAQVLWITTGTVSKHLERIYRKLGVSSRTAALAAAGFGFRS